MTRRGNLRIRRKSRKVRESEISGWPFGEKPQKRTCEQSGRSLLFARAALFMANPPSVAAGQSAIGRRGEPGPEEVPPGSLLRGNERPLVRSGKSPAFPLFQENKTDPLRLEAIHHRRHPHVPGGNPGFSAFGGEDSFAKRPHLFFRTGTSYNGY